MYPHVRPNECSCLVICAIRPLAILLQLELHAHEQLDKAWRRLAKRDAKAAQADTAHVPAAKQPEAIFLPDMLDEFLQVTIIPGFILPLPDTNA